MGRFRGNRLAPIGLAVGVGLLAAACSGGGTASPTTTATTGSTGTTATTSAGGNSAPGITPTTISIGAISSRTGELAGYFGDFAPGMIAYFDTVNAQGGVDGRKINLTYNLDDGGSPSQFTQLTHTLIDQDHVFAVGTASYWFSPDYFASSNTPTYGYNVTGNWSPYPNLYAAGGSVQSYSSIAPSFAYIAKATHSKSLAFISYGPAITSSYDACHTSADDLKADGYNVSFVDVGAQLGGSFSSDVQRLQSSGSDLIFSCMQASDDITLARDIQQYGLKIKQLWLNGYDQSLLNQYSNLMQGVYMNNNGNVPFEAAKDPSLYPGMKAFVSSMDKYEPSDANNNVALAGWQSAALIVSGIKAAGSHLTQADVVNATNKLTQFTGAGTSTVTSWATGHTVVTWPACTAWIQVKGTSFVSVLAPGKQVFACVGPNAKKPVLVPAPSGTPGA